MAQVTLDQKRLEALRRQLQGKSAISFQPSSKKTSITSQVTTDNPPRQTPSIPTEDTSYLKGDLTKIAIISTAAVIFQLALYFSLTSHLLNLNL